LDKQNEILKVDSSVKQSDKGGKVDQKLTGKRPFIEPEVSVPVDVLEATTFFQVASSGATN
jgi:hypothetical protein